MPLTGAPPLLLQRETYKETTIGKHSLLLGWGMYPVFICVTFLYKNTTWQNGDAQCAAEGCVILLFSPLSRGGHTCAHRCLVTAAKHYLGRFSRTKRNIFVGMTMATRFETQRIVMSNNYIGGSMWRRDVHTGQPRLRGIVRRSSILS